jgi:hypothetical protein
MSEELISMVVEMAKEPAMNIYNICATTTLKEEEVINIIKENVDKGTLIKAGDNNYINGEDAVVVIFSKKEIGYLRFENNKYYFNYNPNYINSNNELPGPH